MEQLRIDGEDIPFRVEKARGRRMRMLIDARKGVLIIRTPSGRFDAQARAFLQKETDWIKRHFQKVHRRHDQVDVFHQHLEAGRIPFQGESWYLHRTEAPQRSLRLDPEHKRMHLVSRPEDPWKAVLKRGLWDRAKLFLVPRAEELIRWTESNVNRIFVKDQKSIWGSCSSKSNINLNWHLIFLEEALVDYLIIHELMHLREMNHSKRFWDWVGRYYPDYKMADKMLNEKQWLVGILD
ncbi:MAG: SprT family zinc-dependent metalloprotease [Bacteroidota bacterium]